MGISRKRIRIATRKSPLAMWQAEHVKKRLEHIYPELAIELLGFVTEGDKKLETSLARIGGKGLFVKELENALLNNEADLAVHSLKDVPAQITDGLTLAIICEREDPRDVLVSSKYKCLTDLPLHSVVGTASLRRQCQLLSQRADLRIKTLRGNVQTRLDKLDKEEYDAIVLAAAGLKRLELEHRIREYFSPTLFIPAVGQGVLGIECRNNDNELIELLKPLDDAKTRVCVTAERAMNFELKGGCQIPIGIHGILISASQILLRAMVGLPDGSLIIKGMRQGSITDAEEIGKQLAQQLLQHGADKILNLN